MTTCPRSRRKKAGVLTLGACLSFCAGAASAATVKDVRKKMGSRFEITAVHSDRVKAQLAIDHAYAEIDRIESLISSWRETSLTSEIHRQAGVRPVAVPPELFNLIRRSLKISELTSGAFDITFAGLGGLWNFDEPNPTRPDPEALSKALSRVGYTKIVLDPDKLTVYLDDPEARIGFGAIGKGYAANRSVFVLKEHGIENGVVSAGGDLVAFGHKEDGRTWDIGIAHPDHPGHVFAHLPLSETAVVTSGDYESFVVIDGKRYGHILDPKTGWPVDHLRSVTVVCPDAELADALATATFVMGPQEGLRLINALRGVEALMVDMDAKMHFSDGLRSQLTLTDGDNSTK